jgi:predicted acylesterase/phospholipase RssA
MRDPTSATSSLDTKIGEPKKNTRVLVFAGGGFETARQLGVVHALLVSRGAHPHLIVGASAGAVNAVAAAEILQAGTLEAQVARFREVFESYQNCPDDLLAAMFPDAYEVDVHRPLEQLRLPIQAERERENRSLSLDAKAGLLNLYNDLLRLRISIGTATRFIRRFLGIRGAGALPTKPRRAAALVLELFHTWTLIGYHLSELAPLAGIVVRAAFGWRKHEKGAPAAHLIFRSAFRRRAVGGLSYLIQFILTISAWMLVSVPALVIAGAALWGVSAIVGCECGYLIRLPGTRLGLGDSTFISVFALVVAAVDVIAAGIAGWIASDKGKKTTPQAGKVSRWLTALGAAWGLAAVGTALATVQLLALTTPDDIKSYSRIFLHDAEVAAAGMLLIGFFAAVIAAWFRETAWTDELVSVFGSAVSFVAANLAFLGVLALLVWGSLSFTGNTPLVPLAWMVLVSCQLAIIGGIAVLWCGPSLPKNLLRRYDLANGLLNEHPIRQFFVRLFDRQYYGDIPMRKVLEQAVKGGDKPFQANPAPKMLGDYEFLSPPIHVAIAVADATATPASTENRLLTILPSDKYVVDGLLAAIAVTPFLPPIVSPGHIYLDATNVTNEPTAAALDHLRKYGRQDALDIHMYSVIHLPIASDALPSAPGSDYGELLDVVSRARQLERLRDAKLNRNLTDVFTRTIPLDKPRFPDPESKQAFLRASIFPIEPEKPGEVNRGILRAGSAAARRRIVAEAVADGCRAALETMIAADVATQAGERGRAKCGDVIAALFERRAPQNAFTRLPGASTQAHDAGPGIAEVCEHCALCRPAAKRDLCQLATRTPARPPAEWPGENPSPSPLPVLGQDPPLPSADELPPDIPKGRIRRPGLVWPLDRASRLKGMRVADKNRPTVSFLFSGGVFRGVYQLGALNALNEAHLQPDIIAGASVGSITAAMIARVFSDENDDGSLVVVEANRLLTRRKRIARLSAVYLGIDRLVMTDRFADFIRSVTIRAAHTGFSIRDADRVFRRYDAPWSGVYSREARRVLAGLERLFYASPFEVKDLVESARRQQMGATTEFLRAYIQEWLNRLGVSNQVLGAEPLLLLIEEYVLKGLLPPAESAPGNQPVHDVPFDHFLNAGICFLATVTNLTGGRLEVLGSDQLFNGANPPLLGQSLLASSAFPGVFRPRWSWEFLPGSATMDRYIDGGVTDNLPLDAVTSFLYQAAKAGVIRDRPGVPHLLLATSLEPRLDRVRTEDEAVMANYWPRLYQRAGRLAYNLKLDMYAGAQRSLRKIMLTDATRELTPIDLEVIAVKPEWLCGTFAFHPMMGFRQEHQARSIAHGCFTTLLRLGQIYVEQPTWGKVWGLEEIDLPPKKVFTPQVLSGKSRPRPNPANSAGHCCIRPKIVCPFSRKGTAALGESDMPETIDRLHRIYELCCEAATHQADDV